MPALLTSSFQPGGRGGAASGSGGNGRGKMSRRPRTRAAHARRCPGAADGRADIAVVDEARVVTPDNVAAAGGLPPSASRGPSFAPPPARATFTSDLTIMAPVSWTSIPGGVSSAESVEMWRAGSAPDERVSPSLAQSAPLPLTSSPSLWPRLCARTSRWRWRRRWRWRGSRHGRGDDANDD